jgi:hypothetical protein
MTHVVDLRGNVTLYGQQKCTWCGAATGQMIMNGYPDPAHRLFLTQQTIWNSIQANNSTDPTDVTTNWATDPFGLRDAMMALNAPPSGGHWVVFSNATRDTVMFDILFWMNRNHYPVAVLINKGGHWVALVHFISDVEPLEGTSPTLQTITKYDPEPHNVGTVSTMTGAVWYATDWNGAIIYAGTWLNRYVAVIEPPEAKGTVKIERVTRIGKQKIPPSRAIELVKMWIKEDRIPNRQQHALLARKDLAFLEPIVVTEHAVSIEKPQAEPCYYIVPIGLQMERSKNGSVQARIAVMLNAFTGEFEEITTFGRPVKYLTQDEAVSVAAKALGIRRVPEDVKVSLEFTPSDITHIRAYPYWKVTLKDRSVFVDQLGAVYGRIKISVPGD